MPLAAADAFDDAVARGTPDSVYLLHGDNDFLKEEKVREALAAWSDAATRDFNVDLFRGTETDAGRLSQALDALPMLAARRVVVVRDVGGLRKDARTVLDRYLKSPSPDTALILVAASGWKTDATLTGRATVIELGALSDAKAVTWIGTRARALGSAIDADAARLLLAATGPDLALIDGELRKLRDYAGGEPITASHIDAVIGITSGKTLTDVIDLVCARDGTAAAALIPGVLRQPKATAVGFVMTLTPHMLGIGQVLLDRANRVNPRQQANALYDLLKTGRGVPLGRPWGEAVSVMTRSADHWDGASLDRALLLLADADSALKNTGVSSDEQVLSTLVLAMCGRRRRAGRAA
jgi:DNA polymerase-3 subunit delta